ncbi:MAG: hypothetical protein ACWA40_10335 [Planktomarina sp.]
MTLSEQERIASVKASGKVPACCGPEIPEAPARGGVRVFTPMGMAPKGDDGYEYTDVGYRGRKALMVTDVFDRMCFEAQQRKRPLPFTKVQIATARAYRCVCERLSGSGFKLSSFEGGSGFGGAGAGISEAQLDDADALRTYHRRIGGGVALAVRRIRPSARGNRQAITDYQLVQAVCVDDQTISQTLRKYGWVADAGKVQSKHTTALRTALCAALDRMAPSSSTKITTAHYGAQAAPRAL